jgi:hypothetical protein
MDVCVASNKRYTFHKLLLLSIMDDFLELPISIAFG